MIEAHVVTDQNRHLYEDEWDQFLRLRHDHFVDERGWREPSPDGREIDQFDTPAATYILGIEGGEVVASARIILASDPNMVSEVFPDMCNATALPKSDHWADWTRSLIVKSKRSYGLRGTAGQMACAVMEYCVQEGIEHVGGVQLLYFLPRWQDLGWTATALGAPRVIDGEWCIVAYVDCNAAALAAGRAYCGVDKPLLVRSGLSLHGAFPWPANPFGAFRP